MIKYKKKLGINAIFIETTQNFKQHCNAKQYKSIFWFSIKGPQSKKYFYLFKKFYLPYSVIYLPGSLYRANLVPRFLF